MTADLDRGLSLPATWYTDPEILELEHEQIFRRAWQYFGHADQVAAPGDYLAGAVGRIPIVAVQAEDGLRAFVNVCRHRRHEVMSGAGNRRSLQCPYHAWTYALDGCLRSAPRSEGEPGFCKADFPLLPVAVATWGPWVFVNPDPNAPPLAAVLRELPEIVAQSGIDVAELTFHSRHDWVRDANWKVMIENYLECYHCPVQHPGFSAIIDVRPEMYSLRQYDWFSSQSGAVRVTPLEVGQGKVAVYDARGEIARSQYDFLWPNFTININPGRPNLSIDVWIPDGPGRTRGFSEYYFGRGVPEDFQQELIAFSAQVGAEDDRLTDSVQRGLAAGLPVQGRFLTRAERLVIHFQKLVLTALSS